MDQEPGGQSEAVVGEPGHGEGEEDQPVSGQRGRKKNEAAADARLVQQRQPSW